MENLNVLLVEHVENEVERLKTFFRGVFEISGYSPNFITCETPNSALDELKLSHFDVLVSDISFGYRNTNKFGIKFIAQVKKLWPEVFCFACSGEAVENNDYSVTGTAVKTYDLFIPKSDIFCERENHKKLVSSFFCRHYNSASDVKISIDRLPRNRGKKNPVPSERDVKVLVKQIVFSGHKSDDLCRIRKVDLSRIDDGFSKSLVYSVKAYAADETYECVPSIIKISLLESADDEYDNYQRYVKWFLPYNLRVDVLGRASTMEFGAICYSVAFGAEKSYSSLAFQMADGNSKRVKETVSKLFDRETSTWYDDSLIRPSENIVNRYTSRFYAFGDAREKAEEIFRDLVDGSSDKITLEGKNVRIGQDVFLSPSNALFRVTTPEYLSCVCHGDLHAQNVIVSEENDLTLIDFQHTGRAHVFEDFICLDISLRLHYKLNGCDEILSCYEQEHDLSFNNGDHCELPYRSISLMIRNLAFQNFPSEREENYWYGLACVSYSLLRFTPKYSDKPEYVARLLSTMLVALKKYQSIIETTMVDGEPATTETTPQLELSDQI